MQARQQAPAFVRRLESAEAQLGLPQVRHADAPWAPACLPPARLDSPERIMWRGHPRWTKARECHRPPTTPQAGRLFKAVGEQGQGPQQRLVPPVVLGLHLVFAAGRGVAVGR
jgi:hypothetical protein